MKRMDSNPKKLNKALENSSWYALIFPFYTYMFFQGNWMNKPACITNSLRHLTQRLQGASGDSGSYHKFWEMHSICIDPYWANQWLKNYDAGLAKRGLLGAVNKFISPDYLNIIGLNIACFLIGLGLIYLVIYMLKDLTKANNCFLATAGAALCLTPFTKVITETTGDPLHVIAILTFAAALICKKLFKTDSILSEVLVCLTYITCILIYEGAFLLILPFLLAKASRPLVTGTALALAITVVINFSGTEEIAKGHKISQSYMAYNPITQLSMNYNPGAGLASKESFLFNIKQEGRKYISDPKNAFDRLTSSLIPAGSYAALIALILNLGGNAKAASQFTKSWFILLLVSAPFFLITHDWFRYYVFTIIMSLTTTYSKNTEGGIQEINSARETKKKPLFVALLATGLVGLIAVGPISADVRIHLPQGLLLYQVAIFSYFIAVNYMLFHHKASKITI
jgi:hypothetical protein